MVKEELNEFNENLRICKDCIFYKFDDANVSRSEYGIVNHSTFLNTVGRIFHRCKRNCSPDKMVINLVTGEKYIRKTEDWEMLDCVKEREDEDPGNCGPKGIFYKKRDESDG